MRTSCGKIPVASVGDCDLDNGPTLSFQVGPRPDTEKKAFSGPALLVRYSTDRSVRSIMIIQLKKNSSRRIGSNRMSLTESIYWLCRPLTPLAFPPGWTPSVKWLGAVRACWMKGCRLWLNPDNILKCGRCRKALYCSRDCQKKHWKAEHKQQCVPR